MDVKQAREIIKNNYPPENYTMLREALDWLLEQAEKVENLQEILRVVYNLSITEINAGYEIRRYFESRILGLEKLIE